MRNTSQYLTLQATFDAAFVGDTILAQNKLTVESLNLKSNVQISLRGGYDSTYTNVTGSTVLSGTLTIGNGQLTIGNFTIQ